VAATLDVLVTHVNPYPPVTHDTDRPDLAAHSSEVVQLRALRPPRCARHAHTDLQLGL